MKKYLTIFLFCLAPFLGNGQSDEIDSLREKLLAPALKDTTKITVSLALAKQFMSINIDSFGKYTKIALVASQNDGQYKLPKIYNLIGVMHNYNLKPDSGRYYFDKALKILDKKDDKMLRAAVYNNYAMSFNTSNEYTAKIDYQFKVIELLKDNPNLLCKAYFNQAIYYAQAQFEAQSRKYFRLAYLESLNSKNELVEGAALAALGEAYVEEEKLDSAKIYLERGLALCDRIGNPQACFQVNFAQGRLHTKQKEFDRADHFLKEANRLALERNSKSNIVLSYILLGTNELKRGDYQKSVNYFESIADISHEDIASVYTIDGYKDWSEAESRLGNFERSSQLMQKYAILKDSMFAESNRIAVSNAEAKYETEKKDKELLAQQLALEQSVSKTRIMSILIVSLLLASILLWFVFQQRQKRIQQQLVTIQREQEVRTLESLMEGEEKERSRIAKELHDGVNGDLSAIKFKLSSLLETNNKVIKETVTMIDKSCEQVRAISHNLVPPLLKDFNLLEAIDDYCQNMNSIHNPAITFQHVGKVIQLHKKQEANLFRIVQELVTNSIKHAQAHEINVQLSHVADTMQITVEDDGIGFDKENIKGDGLGLKNVASRVAYLEGTLDFVSNDKGTSYTISVDMNKTRS